MAERKEEKEKADAMQVIRPDKVVLGRNSISFHMKGEKRVKVLYKQIQAAYLYHCNACIEESCFPKEGEVRAEMEGCLFLVNLRGEVLRADLLEADPAAGTLLIRLAFRAPHILVGYDEVPQERRKNW